MTDDELARLHDRELDEPAEPDEGDAGQPSVEGQDEGRVD